MLSKQTIYLVVTITALTSSTLLLAPQKPALGDMLDSYHAAQQQNNRDRLRYNRGMEGSGLWTRREADGSNSFNWWWIPIGGFVISILVGKK